MDIRFANITDISTIQDLGRQTFFNTYEPFIAKEQVAYMYEMMYAESSLLEQMEARGDYFVLASAGEQYIGFASFQINYLPDTHWAKLHKLYVLPKIQTAGIGSALLRFVEQYCFREKQQQALVLNVNRFNTAIKFYERLGFEVYKEVDIDIGNGYFMNDFEMKKMLLG